MIDYINSLDAKQLEEAIVKAGAKKEKIKSYKENIKGKTLNKFRQNFNLKCQSTTSISGGMN